MPGTGHRADVPGVFYQHRVDPDIPIPGTTKLHRLKENIGAVSIQLTADELQEIEVASAQFKVMGARYTEQMDRSTGL